LVLWAVVIFAFCSASKSKLLTYILPALPALAILLARLCERALAEHDHTFLSRGSRLLVVFGAATFLSGAGLGFFISHWRFPLVRPYLFAGGLLLSGAGYLAGIALQRRGPRAALQVFTAAFVALLALTLNGRGLANSYRGVSLAAAREMRAGDRVASYGSYVQGLPFYTGQRVAVVRYQGELDFGSHQGDQSAWFWAGDDQLRREWSRPGRLFLVIRPGDLAAINPPLEPAPTQLASEGKVVLVVNRPGD
jgi:4-amino-4-deoxy-L-arabinose transferase-like glycosyltransferase